MSGFANDLIKTDILVCSGKTVVEVGTQKVLISMHKALYLKHNIYGLLSMGQVQEVGTQVNDTIHRHGGGQCIASQKENRYSYNFDLDVTDGLLTLDTQYLTQDELKSLPTVCFTSSYPWDPDSLAVKDKHVLPFTDGTLDDTIESATITMQRKTWLDTSGYHPEDF